MWTLHLSNHDYFPSSHTSNLINTFKFGPCPLVARTDLPLLPRSWPASPAYFSSQWAEHSLCPRSRAERWL